MKKSIIPSATLYVFLLCFFNIHISKAQHNGQVAYFAAALEKETTPKQKLQPDFKAGQHKASFDGLHDYTVAHLAYPESARENSIEGKVSVILEISPEGKVMNPVILKSLGYGCDEAVFEMLRCMPDWKPATNYGIPVKSKQAVDFNFSLR